MILIYPFLFNIFGIVLVYSYLWNMKIKIKYHIEIGNEVIECETLEQAERKMKGLSEVEKYLIKTESKGDTVINQFLIG